MTQREALEAALHAGLTAGELAGAAALVWRAGGEPEVVCAGWRDAEARVPMTRDTLFRIASMTKPITSVVALMLMEEGRFSLDDAVTRWAPELLDLRVLRTPTSALDDTVPLARAITFGDLLTHRAGLTYGPFRPGPLERAYESLGGDLDSHLTPDAWVAALSRLPLIHQPGTRMHYSHATDLLGILLARMEGTTLMEVMRRRLFEPLGMKDTTFTVPVEKHPRRAALYGFDDAGKRVRKAACPGGSSLEERPTDLTFEAGGQGLWSTLDDYLAFARLFVEGGSVGGVRILRADTLARMVSNQLSPSERARSDLGGMELFASGQGFGLGVAVVMEPAAAMATLVGGNAGSVGWPGGFGGWWRADPEAREVLVFLTHNLVERAQFDQGIGFGVYGAITGFQRAAQRQPA